MSSWDKTNIESLYTRNGMYCGRKMVDGKLLTKSHGTRDRVEAIKVHRAWLSAIELGAGDEPLSVDEAIALHELKGNVLELKKGSIRKWVVTKPRLLEGFAGIDMRHLRMMHIDDYVRVRRKQKPRPSDSTILSEMSFLAAVMRTGREREKHTNVIVTTWAQSQKTKANGVKKGDARERYLSHAEEDALLAAALVDTRTGGFTSCQERGHHVQTAFLTMIDCGLREQEVCKLQWSQLSLDMRYINCPEFVSIDGEQVEYSKGSTGKVPVSPRLRAALMAMQRKNDHDYVFWHHRAQSSDGVRHPAGRPWKGWLRTVEGCAKQAGLTNVHTHDLRRTCGCRLLQDKKLPMSHVSNWLRHASVKITEKAYAFLRVEHLAEAAGYDVFVDEMEQT